MNNRDKCEGYVEGWKDAQNIINWEMKALGNENLRLKKRNQELEISVINIKNIIKC